MLGLVGVENSEYLPFHMRSCSRDEVTCLKVWRGGEQQPESRTALPPCDQQPCYHLMLLISTCAYVLSEQILSGLGLKI